MKTIKKLSLFLTLCLILTACSAKRDTDITLVEPVEVLHDTATVTRMDLSRRRQYEAYVKAEIEEVAFEKRSGLLKEFYVSLGDTVEKGDPIAALDVSALEEQIATAEDELDYRKKKLAHDLKQKQYDIELAELDLDVLLASEADAVDIEVLEVSLNKLKHDAEYIRKSAELDIEQVRKKVNTLKQSLEGSVITSPCDGEVAYIQPISEGSRVAANTAVAYIADKSRLYVQYDGTDNISSDLRITALINGNEHPLVKEEYEQQEYLALMLSGRRPPSLFLFEGDGDIGDISAGDFAALLVYESEKPNVPAIPTNAVFYNAGKYYVYLIEDGEKIYTEVECGLRTDAFTEITGGLEEGDVVFVKQ